MCNLKVNLFLLFAINDIHGRNRYFRCRLSFVFIVPQKMPRRNYISYLIFFVIRMKSERSVNTLNRNFYILRRRAFSTQRSISFHSLLSYWKNYLILFLTSTGLTVDEASFIAPVRFLVSFFVTNFSK